MSFSAMSLKQVCFCVPFLLLLSANVLSRNVQPRADPCDDGEDILPTSDGPTSDKSPGIGVEFESLTIVFQSENQAVCKQSTDESKGQLVDNRKGKNWKLTADTTQASLNSLDAEYILDGTQIKIGEGTAVQAATDAANDLRSWNPWTGMQNPRLTIEESECNPWIIVKPTANGAFNNVIWAPQITAPMPLEAIQDLFKQIVAGIGQNPLKSSRNPGNRMVYVTKEFFQSSPYGLSPDKVGDDLLGFFSLVVSYAKSAREELPDVSPKELTTIMPRTDFTNIYRLFSSKITGQLYDIVSVLACYENYDGEVDFDSNFCKGDAQSPEPNGKMDQQAFSVNSNGKSDSCTVREWLQSIQDGTSPDRLSQLDQVIDGSIGGLKDAFENVLGTKKAVPLFEFRNLDGKGVGQWADFVGAAEQAVINYHNSLPKRFIRRRLDHRFTRNKRQNSTACALSLDSSSSIAPSASTSLISATTSTPSATPSPTDSCNVAWKVVYDSFEIKGTDWPVSKLGVNGDGLKTQIKGCGALTDWSFEQANTTAPFTAQGHLPIGTKDCVGRAVTTSGGITDNCRGPGL